MPLPVLQGAASVSRESLIRLFHRAALDWSRHLGDENALGVGTVICNPGLRRVSQANRVFDAAVPEGLTPADAIAEVDAHFAAGGSRCGGWVLNPSSAVGEQDAFAAAIRSAGFAEIRTEIHLLRAAPRAPLRDIQGLTIIPARASFAHYRALAEEDARASQLPELADAAMLHLDDPRYDALLAIHEGKAVATVGVLSMGEAGVIEDFLVSPSHRGRGIGRLMLQRALEICARSSFKHVLLDVAPDNKPAVRLYRSSGFESIGQFVRHVWRSAAQA